MGAMGDLGVHKSDLIRWLLADEVAQVAAFVGTLHKEGTDVDDNATCLLRMKSGATGSLVASWTYYKGQDNSTVYGVRMVLSKLIPIRTTKSSLSFVMVRLNVIKLDKSQRMRNKRIAASLTSSLLASLEGKSLVFRRRGASSLQVILAAFESEATGKIITL